MPTIKVTVPQAAWSKEEKASIVGALTNGLSDVAKAAGKGDVTQYINVHIEETAEGGYAMGGQIIG